MAVVISGSDEQLRITPFEKVTDGVLADWNSTDDANVQGSTERFGAAVAWNETETTGKLWLVSRRYIPTAGGPARSVKPGGIVSTLRLPDKTWTHRSHQLDMNGIEMEVFSWNGQLLMITYDNTEYVIKYRKLYVWNETEWSEIPFDTSTVENPRGQIARLSVSGPDPWNNTVYLAASAYTLGTSVSRATIARLDIVFDPSTKKPINANLTSIHYPTYSKEGSIACTPFLPDFNRVYEFWYSSSMINAGQWFSIDSNRTKRFPMNTTSEKTTPFLIDENNCFQYRSEAVFFGQRLSSADGKFVPHVWAYDLRRQKLRDANVSLSNASSEITIIAHSKVIGDKSGAIYAVDLEKGVFEARMSYGGMTKNARTIDEEDDDIFEDEDDDDEDGPSPPVHHRPWSNDEEENEDNEGEEEDEEEDEEHNPRPWHVIPPGMG